MAERFRATFESYEGNDYTFSIYDNDFVGTRSTISLTNIVASTEASDNEIYTPIISAKLEVGIRFDYNDSSDLLQFFEDVAGEQEDRFGCILTLTGGSEPVFVGVLRLDAMKIPNKPYGSIDLTFLDGISLLKDKEYKNGSSFYNVGTSENLLEHVQNCLEKLPTFSLYLAGDDLLKNSINWYHTDMGGSGDDTLNKARCSHAEFTKTDEEGQKEASSCFDVLESILRRYFAVLSYNPSPYANYTIQHVRSNVEATIDYVAYKPTRNAYLVPGFNRDGGANTFLSNGVYSFFPGVNRIEIQQNWETVGITEPVITNANEPAGFKSLGNHVVETVDTKLAFFGSVDTLWDVADKISRPVGAAFAFTIKIDNGTTPYYATNLEVGWTPVSGSGFESYYTRIKSGFDSWSTSERKNVFCTESFSNKKGRFSLRDFFNIISLPIEGVYTIGTEFEVSYKFELLNPISYRLQYYDSYNSNWTIDGYQRFVGFTMVEGLTVTSGQKIGKLTASNFGNTSSFKLEYPLNLAYADALGNTSLEIRNSSGVWIKEQHKWKKSGATDYSLAELIIRDYYAMQRATIQKYQGSARGSDIWANMRLTYSHANAASDEVFIPIRTSHNLATDILEGVFYKSAIFLGSPTIEETFIYDSSKSNSTSAANSSSSNSTGSNGTSSNVPAVVNVYQVTGQTGTTISINDATVASQSVLTDLDMDLLVITVKRGSTYLNYNRTSPNNVEFYALQNGTDVDIILGRAAVSGDVFRIKINEI